MGMRPTFQFHLSTAIVLMVAAGGMMWPNLIFRPVAFEKPPRITANEYARIHKLEFKIDLEKIRFKYSNPFKQDDEDSRMTIGSRDKTTHINPGFRIDRSMLGLGWPCLVVAHRKYSFVTDKGSEVLAEWETYSGAKSIVANLLAALGIFAVIVVASERWIRRRNPLLNTTPFPNTTPTPEQ